MLTVLTWLWGQRYTAAHVNRLARLVAKHYGKPHRFLCVTNQPEGLDCDHIEDYEDFANIRSPHGGQFPSCYRRLRMFHPHAADLYGERFVSLDLDMAIVGDLPPLWDRPEDCVLLRDPLYPWQYNGSMVLLTAGARPDVWEQFDPAQSPLQAKASGFRGSDQAWLSLSLPGEATWGPDNGVYSFSKDCRRGLLPPCARLVSFHGRVKPWDAGVPSWANERAAP